MTADASLTPHDQTMLVPGSLGAHALAWLTELRGAGRAEGTLRNRARYLRCLFAAIPAAIRCRLAPSGPPGRVTGLREQAIQMRRYLLMMRHRRV